MRPPRFRIRTLMIAVAVAPAGLTSLATLAARSGAGAGMVLRDNYSITISVSPLGWLVLGSFAALAIGAAAAIAWAIREG